MSSRLPFLALLALVAGCAVGPDFQPPAAPAVNSYTTEPLPPQTMMTDNTGGESQRFIDDMDVPGQWWTLFHSQQLNELIDQALKTNPDVQSAQAALREARENVYAQQGAYFPSVQGNFSPSRNKTATGTLSPATASGNPSYSLYTGQVTVSYAPDVFGLNRRTVESLEAQADAQRFELEATYLTLTSNVVAAAIQEASLRGQIAAAEEIIKIETDALTILRHQFSLGQVAGTDVAAQEAALAQAQTNLPPLEKQLAQEHDLLTELIGHFPSEAHSATFELAELHLPGNLPVSLPAKLVQQRPDIRAAEAQLHSASAEIGVAIANMLPNLTFSANDGVTAISLDRLFGPGTAFWTLMASLTQPLFEGGQLLHKTRAARAAFDAAAAEYRSTVLVACQNVADTLHALQSDAEALAAADAAERAARTSLDLTHQQFEHGQVAYLALLNAEQAYQLERTNLVQAQAQRYADTDALFEALGGGWWNRTDVEATDGGLHR